jgi:hypothetical protein
MTSILASSALRSVEVLLVAAGAARFTRRAAAAATAGCSLAPRRGPIGLDAGFE